MGRTLVYALLVILWSSTFATSIPASAQVSSDAAAATPLGIDVISSADSSSSSTRLTTRPFSTSTQAELLLAFVSADSNLSAGNTVTSLSGAGLNWKLVARANNQPGDAEIWRAFAPAILNNVSVAANLSQSAAASITVVAFNGVGASGSNGAGAVGASGSFSSASGAPTASLVTTRANSWVFAVGADWDNAIARQLGANQTMVHQYLASVNDSYWVQRQNTATAPSGTTVMMNDTAPTNDRYNMAVVEVLPAAGVAPSPDFSLTVSPSSQSVQAGGSTTYAATIAAQNGFSAATNLSASGLPSGAMATFNPASITGSGTSQLTISTTGSLAAGSYPFTITGTSGSLSHSLNVTLVVGAPADFTLSATPAGQSVQPGGTANFATTIAAQNGYSGTASLTVSGLPAGATGTFTPASITGSGTSQLAITTTGSLLPGTYPLAIGAVDGNLTHSAKVSLTVTGTSPVGLSIDTVSSGDRSSSGNSATTLQFSTTAGNELLLAFVAADSGLSAGNTVTSVTGAGLNWQLVGRANKQPGDAEIWRAFASGQLSNVSVTANLSQPAAASITVVAFNGADASGSNGAAAVGASGSFNSSSGAPTASLVTTRANSWVFAVGADWDNAITRQLGASQTMVHQYLASVNDTYWVQRQNTAAAPSGTTVMMNDTAPTSDRYNMAVVEVLPSSGVAASPDFSLSAAPSSQSIQAGASTTYTVTVTAQNGFSAATNLSVTRLPSGATGVFNPSSVTGSGTSQLTISTTGSLAGGSYPFTITGTSGGLSHSMDATLVVGGAAADFALTATPASQSVQPGGSASYTAAIAAQNGYSGTANLTVTGLPAGATGSFTPPSITASGSSQLAVSTTSSVAAGNYPLVITAQNGNLTHIANVTLSVGSAPSPNFTLAASPASQSVQAGSAVSYAITVTAQNGYASATAFSTTGLPSGATASFNPLSVTGSGTSQLNVAAASSLAPGSYPFTVTATGGSISHTSSLTLVVTARADFTVRVTPPTQSVLPGSPVTFTVSIAGQNGYAAAANLSISGLPSGATGTFNPSSVTGTGSSQLTVSTSASVAPGNYPLTFTASSGSLSHVANATLVVNSLADFSVSVTPSSASTQPGGTASYAVSVAGQNGYSGTANLTVTGLPSGGTGTFNPVSVNGSGTTQLTITTIGSTPIGNYPLTITAASGSLSHTASAILAVSSAPHSVDLSWTDSDTGIAGFNVYRSNQSGNGFTKLNSSLITAMLYTDSTVQSGATYYFVVTAVNSAGVESAFSAPVQAVIP